MATNQAYLFMVFSLVGIIIGLLFDLFRVLRKTFKTKDIITYIEDILFWMITGIIIIVAMYYFSDGELRFFMIIGLILGTAIYLFTVSKVIINIFIWVIDFIKRIIIYPIKLIQKVIKKYFFRQLLVIFINFRKNFTKLSKKIKKVGDFLKKRRNIIVYR